MTKVLFVCLDRRGPFKASKQTYVRVECNTGCSCRLGRYGLSKEPDACSQRFYLKNQLICVYLTCVFFHTWSMFPFVSVVVSSVVFGHFEMSPRALLSLKKPRCLVIIPEVRLLFDARPRWYVCTNATVLLFDILNLRLHASSIHPHAIGEGVSPCSSIHTLPCCIEHFGLSFPSACWVWFSPFSLFYVWYFVFGIVFHDKSNGADLVSDCWLQGELSSAAYDAACAKHHPACCRWTQENNQISKEEI